MPIRIEVSLPRRLDKEEVELIRVSCKKRQKAIKVNRK